MCIHHHITTPSSQSPAVAHQLMMARRGVIRRNCGLPLATTLAFYSSVSSLQFPIDLTNQMILAPLTRGGNLPYRRLCADFGCQVSLSEMVYARSLLKGDRIEHARLRRAPNEKCFGVQIATNNVEEGRDAMDLIRSVGTADFVDLNVGCPIREATRRGLGSSLLRSPTKLGRLVSGMATNSELPLTVKIRLGCEDDTINVDEVVRTLCESGAAAITIHGRTAQQRYSRTADWERIRRVLEDNRGSGVPIIGNGDILTHYEARRRMEESGANAVMVGRGALTKPWIFQEHADGNPWAPDAMERVEVYRRLATYMKQHFGDDDMGKRKSFHFLPWHFEFLCRYVDFPEEEYGEASVQSPLMQSRITPLAEELSPLDKLLLCRNKDTHQRIAEELWEATSDEDAVTRLAGFAESAAFREMQAADSGEDVETEELANLPKRHRNDDRRRGRNPKPQRTPEEIRIIRAERAAKKAALALEAGASPGGIAKDTALTGPFTNQHGVLKRWISTGRSGSFGFVGISGTKSEYICFEDALGDGLLPVDETSLPMKIVFDTEVTKDTTQSDRAINVRPA